MNAWIQHFAEETLARAEREIEALVAVSTPSGDRAAAEEAVAVVSAMLPPGYHRAGGMLVRRPRTRPRGVSRRAGPTARGCCS